MEVRQIALVALVALAAAAGGTAPSPEAPTRGTTLLLWPAGPPVFGDLPGGGPGTTVVVADLSRGRRSVRWIPGIAPGDFPVPLLQVGRRLVYNRARGVSAISVSLKGSPRVIGRATYFVPSATRGRVWLVRADRRSGRAVEVQSASVAGARRGPALALPPGTGVVEGADAGLLLVSRTGELELWRPGARPRALARLGPVSAGAGVAATARLVAYATGCRVATATSGFPRVPVGYELCDTLHVADVVAGTRRAFAAPRGTLGWTPLGFGVGEAIASGGKLLVAEAALPPESTGRIRLFLLRLRRGGAPTPVPASTARLGARTAWSPDGSRLFYQGPGERLRAFRPATGAMRSFSIRCCRYAAMLAVRSRSR